MATSRTERPTTMKPTETTLDRSKFLVECSNFVCRWTSRSWNLSIQASPTLLLRQGLTRELDLKRGKHSFAAKGLWGFVRFIHFVNKKRLSLCARKKMDWILKCWSSLFVIDLLPDTIFLPFSLFPNNTTNCMSLAANQANLPESRDFSGSSLEHSLALQFSTWKKESIFTGTSSAT